MKSQADIIAERQPTHHSEVVYRPVRSLFPDPESYELGDSEGPVVVHFVGWEIVAIWIAEKLA